MQHKIRQNRVIVLHKKNRNLISKVESKEYTRIYKNKKIIYKSKVIFNIILYRQLCYYLIVSL